MVRGIFVPGSATCLALADGFATDPLVAGTLPFPFCSLSRKNSTPIAIAPSTTAAFPPSLKAFWTFGFPSNPCAPGARNCDAACSSNASPPPPVPVVSSAEAVIDKLLPRERELLLLF